MAIYQEIGYGAKGEAVRRLQETLNQQGYTLDEDGVFGTKTRAAVQDYQKKNDLLLDGIAGDETWGSLMAAKPQDTATALSGTGQTLARLEQGYTPSADVSAAGEMLRSTEALRPEAYSSGFQEQLSALYGEINGRTPFSYDPDSDPAYRAYAANYTRLGREAMTDTLGRAAALTGGYGSSYAQSAAQQSYNGYLSRLAEVTPELETAAYSRYRDEGEALLQRYELLQGQEESAYDRWQDEVAQWQKEVSSQRGEYEGLRDDDLKNYQLLLGYFSDKAAAEAKGTGLPATQTGAVSSIGNTSSLSSTGAESLEKAVANYQKLGQREKAAALLQQYESRMTPAQKARFQPLFAACGL